MKDFSLETLFNTAYTAHFVRLNFGYAETSCMLETLIEVGDNCLPQGDATIIGGHLPVGENLETVAFQVFKRFP